jgi:hypothetical protein
MPKLSSFMYAVWSPFVILWWGLSLPDQRWVFCVVAAFLIWSLSVWYKLRAYSLVERDWIKTSRVWGGGGDLSDIFFWPTCNSAVSCTILCWSLGPAILSFLRRAKKLRFGCSCGRVSFNCWSPVAFQHRFQKLGPRPANESIVFLDAAPLEWARV